MKHHPVGEMTFSSNTILDHYMGWWLRPWLGRKKCVYKPGKAKYFLVVTRASNVHHLLSTTYLITDIIFVERQTKNL